MRRRPILAAIAVGLVFLLGAIGHVLYWYAPRVHTGKPKPGALPARLLDHAHLPAAVWVPYPHQNLAVLKERAPDLISMLESVARLGGLPRPRLPSFGPLAVPPASEMTLATDGDRFVVAARIYPSAAIFARLAGRLARNPWLAGGELSEEGRRIEIAWYGNVWTVASPAFPDLTSSAEPSADTGSDAIPASASSALMLLAARQTKDPLPSGLYQLTLDDDALDLRSVHDTAPPSPLGGELFATIDRDLFLLALSGGRRDLGEPRQALSFYTGAVGSNDMPRVASMYVKDESAATGKRDGRAVRKPWSLPGAGILGLTGRAPLRGVVGTWHVKTLDRTSLERAIPFASRLDGILDDADLGWGLWLDLDGGLREVERIAGILEQVPIVSRRRKERWRDAQIVLQPLSARFSEVSIVVTDARQLRLRMARRTGPPAAATPENP